MSMPPGGAFRTPLVVDQLAESAKLPPAPEIQSNSSEEETLVIDVVVVEEPASSATVIDRVSAPVPEAV